jgi:hypothetical protein
MRLLVIAMLAFTIVSFRGLKPPTTTTLTPSESINTMGFPVHFIGSGYQKGKTVLVTIPYSGNRYADFIAGTADAKGKIEFDYTFLETGDFTVSAYQSTSKGVTAYAEALVSVY